VRYLDDAIATAFVGAGGYALEKYENDQRGSSRTPAVPILVAESLRNAASTNDSAPAPKGEERISVFWRVFGGTLLSIAALVVLTLCQYFNNNLNELRNDLSRLNEEFRKDLGHLNNDLHKDLGHLNEINANLVTKEDFNNRLKSVWDTIKDLRALGETVASLKERALLHDQQMKSQTERKELIAEIQHLRERLANLEGRQAANSTGVKPAVHREGAPSP
jgi:hypothetical protein